jgi:hypothetical protein
LGGSNAGRVTQAAVLGKRIPQGVVSPVADDSVYEKVRDLILGRVAERLLAPFHAPGNKQAEVDNMVFT